MELKGIDISHWNQKDTIDKYVGKHTDFIIMKATEGKTHVDIKLEYHNQKCDYYGVFKGFYHFARPDLGNTPAQEAHNFLTNIQNKGQALYALDIEGQAILVKNIDKWALEWLDHVKKHTGVKPLIYCSQSQTQKFQECAKENYGLWVARYGKKIGSIWPWKFAAIWQHTSTPIDKNIFFGNENQLLKYMKGD